ncbi:MAG: toll/interleukin-1 receptor domain-containing protein [Alphaproteobacteria bacterium]|nr:toll/interleukin-1 receptor domain-containing protein [Alphaproteobacteria bacterium]
MSGFEYNAFVSYSHADDLWARWILRGLESYRVPRHLVGTEGTHGPIPKRLNKIFRDREELAAGHCLDKKIEEALRKSQVLLVVCSPNAATSYGVAREIELFKEMRGEEHIFYIIIDGEPNAAARGLDSRLECFPTPLIGKQEQATNPYQAPLAADARPSGDGKRQALQKVIAGILGINLDTLVRRDLQRRQRRMALITGSALLGMTLTSALAFHAYRSSEQSLAALAHAQRQQDEAESLIRFISGRINHTLWRRGQDDLIRDITDRLIQHYEGQNRPNMGPEEISRYAASLEFLARTQMENSQNHRVAELIDGLVETTRAQLSASAENKDNLYTTHIGALGVGYLSNYLRGNFDVCQQMVDERFDLLNAILKTGNTERHIKGWLSDTYMARGHLKMLREALPGEAVTDIEHGIKIRREIAENNPLWLGSVGGGLRYLANIYMEYAPIAHAIEKQQEALANYKTAAQSVPQDLPTKFLQHRFYLELADMKLQAGNASGALEAIDLAQSGMAPIIEARPWDIRKKIHFLLGNALRGQQSLLLEDTEIAYSYLHDTATELGSILASSDESSDAFTWFLDVKAWEAKALVQLGRHTEASKLVNEIDIALKSRPKTFFESHFGRRMTANFLDASIELQRALGEQEAASALCLLTIEKFWKNQENYHPAIRATLLKALDILGKREEAKLVSNSLYGLGYRSREFLALKDRLDSSSGE